MHKSPNLPNVQSTYIDLFGIDSFLIYLVTLKYSFKLIGILINALISTSTISLYIHCREQLCGPRLLLLFCKCGPVFTNPSLLICL